MCSVTSVPQMAAAEALFGDDADDPFGDDIAANPATDAKKIRPMHVQISKQIPRLSQFLDRCHRKN